MINYAFKGRGKKFIYNSRSSDTFSHQKTGTNETNFFREILRSKLDCLDVKNDHLSWFKTAKVNILKMIDNYILPFWLT